MRKLINTTVAADGQAVRIRAATVEQRLPQRVGHWLYGMPVKRWYKLVDVEVVI